MGGLVAQYFTEILGGREITRQVIAIGTPYYGSLRALSALADGSTLPFGLLAEGVCKMARTLPSMHELVPALRLRCGAGLLPRRLTSGDLSAVGADLSLTAPRKASTMTPRCGWSPRRALSRSCLCGHRSAHRADGRDRRRRLTLYNTIGGEDRAGDGTVFREAASPLGAEAPQYVSQRHGRLASAPETIIRVAAVLTERPLGPPMSAVDEIGIDVPSGVAVGQPFRVRVLADLGRRLLCTAIDLDTGRQVAVAVPTPFDGELSAQLILPRPGLYSIRVKGGGGSPVGEMILAWPGPAHRTEQARRSWRHPGPSDV